MLQPTLFNTVLIFPVVNVLLLFNYVFDFVHLPGAFGLSIIALTIAVRLVLHPFSHQQMQLARKMEEMKPHLDNLSKKHKDDKKKLQEAQMKLYKDMGVNPASGCLYAIVQIPLFIALYNVLQLFLTNGNAGKIVMAVNKIVYFDFLKIASIDPWFFGFNLAASPSQFSKFGFYYLAIPAVTALLQYWQVKAMTPTVKKPATPTKEKGEPDMQTMMSRQMQFMFPLMIGYFSYILPVGLALYWNVFSIFSILQYRKKN